jgi:16S rRNA (cytosine1402-N4)-methyltransferase
MEFKPVDRIKPSAEELKGNPRSGSAIMRVAERLVGAQEVQS